MGAACCVPFRDRKLQHESRSEILHRSIRQSPSWSFRWDNRGRVAGEETSVSFLSDGFDRNNPLDIKSTTEAFAHASDGGKAIFRNISMEVKDSMESPRDSYPASIKLSPSSYSTSPVPTSPLSSHHHLLPPASTPSRRVCRSRGHELSQSRRNSPSINSISEESKVSYAPQGGINESTRDSHGMPSDSWSLLAFSELLSASDREMCFGSESSSMTRDMKARSNGQNSSSLSIDLQTCGICSKVLAEKSASSSQKIHACNELSVVAILTCGHVFHAECLENVTLEINKYDPTCPVCTFGEKQAFCLSGKVLRAERDLKVRRYKKSRNRVVDTEDSIEFDYWKSNGHEGKDPRMNSSSSLKSSWGKPFLRRQFSFGLNRSKSTPETPSFRRK